MLNSWTTTLVLFFLYMILAMVLRLSFYIIFLYKIGIYDEYLNRLRKIPIYFMFSLPGMFGPSFGQQSSSSSSYNNYFPGNGDFNTWGSSQQVNAGNQQQQQHQHQQGSNNKSQPQHQQSSQNRRNGPPYDDHYNNRDNNAYGNNDGVKVRFVCDCFVLLLECF